MKSLSGVDGVFLHLEPAQGRCMSRRCTCSICRPGVTTGDFLAEVRRQNAPARAHRPGADAQAPRPCRCSSPTRCGWKTGSVGLPCSTSLLEPPGAGATGGTGRAAAIRTARPAPPLWRMAVIDGLASGGGLLPDPPRGARRAGRRAARAGAVRRDAEAARPAARQGDGGGYHPASSNSPPPHCATTRYVRSCCATCPMWRARSPN